MTKHSPIRTQHAATSARDIEAVWRMRYPSFLKAAHRLANGDHHVAEALVSRTTIRILEYVRTSDEPIQNIEAFFFTSLRNSAMDHWRRKRRDTDGLRDLGHHLRQKQDKDQTLSHVMARQELRDIARHLSRLPPEMAEPVRLRILQNQPYARIAERFGISEALARKRVQIARRQLRDVLRRDNLAASRHKSARIASCSTKHTQPSGDPDAQ
ncbi:RNA polymerase sigma factor [Thalassococcus sp. S3]|uniref:RNA polymerase sigma factor n=1 Tax=Thalassococcus sp. S3 TaxID=2017482 RepID=UPI00102408AF|nr:sigma-70 family RNA polymerase sigma factor [Thalassococcus sp. S3]QBF31193.1 RNA polymerase subunit sigma-70 [Thalassococcus sp. S3]